MMPEQYRRLGKFVGGVLTVGAMGFAILGCESLRSSTLTPPHVEPPVASSQQPKRPAKHWIRVGQYVFYSDAPLDSSDPLFRELGELPEQLHTELGIPVTDSLVQVFLFETREKYDQFLAARYPKLPNRPAYFLAEPRTKWRIGEGATNRDEPGDDLLVFTWLGENLRTDLRHELTHATLHGVLKGVPLWLDEGLACFFELPPAHNGVNTTHLETLRRGPFQPDLARLEKFTQVKQMEKPEYREAWAWVHLLLRGSPETKQVLREYLEELRTNPTPGPLLPRLTTALGEPNQVLAEHLTKMEFPILARR